MKTFRILLLMLLAVLLPIRGAVAAAMLCAPVGGGNPEAVAGVEDELHHHQMGGVDSIAHAPMDPRHGAHAHSAAPGSDAHHGVFGKCGMCGDLCSMTPLPVAPTTLATPSNPAMAWFPDCSARAPSFLSDGQERPPRTS